MNDETQAAKFLDLYCIFEGISELMMLLFYRSTDRICSYDMLYIMEFENHKTTKSLFYHKLNFF